MTRDNLELALKLNNDVIIQEINLIVDYVNDLASDQKITNYELERSIKANSISGVSDRLEALETTVTNNFHDINEDYSAHKNNSAIHVTQSDKDNWNSSKTYTDQELSDHASNKNLHVTKNLQDTWNDHVNDTVIHVVQSDKDYWNSILNISKQYAKQLFDSVTSINLIKCEELPEEDIQELTIYMLKVAEGSEEENDLYDEYMYIDGEWERIGSTRVNLEDYVTKTLLQTELGYINQSITSIQQQLHSHTNINILNKLSEDNSGNLLYDNNRISAKSSMSEIIDINITNLSNGDTLKYNSTDQKWENKPDNVLEIDDASTSNSKLWSSNKTNTEINKSYKDTDSAGTTIADDDYFPFYDTSASDKKKSTWSNVKSVLKTYFDTLYSDTLYSTVTSRGTPTSAGTTLSLVNTGDMYNWNTDTVIYCTCSTSASTTAKVATVQRGTFTLTAGAKVCVKFTYSNTASAPTLNVASKGAKNIKYIGTDGTVETPNVWWGAGDVVTFIYDGTQWLMMPTISMIPSLPVVGTMSKSDLYSTTEKVVGMWTDGRPIYQKVITVTMPNATNGTDTKGTPVSVGTTVLKYISVVGFAQTSGYTFAFGTYRINNARTIYLIANDNSASDNKNTIIPQSSYESFNGVTVPVVVQYTKTTDAANSYNYANENDYSTSEKIIGKWIDGSNLYQKTIAITLPNASSSEEASAWISIGTTVKLCISCTGYFLNGGNRTVPLGISTSSGSARAIVGLSNYSSNANKIGIFNSNLNWNSASGYVTIQYTKP